VFCVADRTIGSLPAIVDSSLIVSVFGEGFVVHEMAGHRIMASHA
jgi:hypothetical protein